MLIRIPVVILYPVRYSSSSGRSYELRWDWRWQWSWSSGSKGGPGGSGVATSEMATYVGGATLSELRQK